MMHDSLPLFPSLPACCLHMALVLIKHACMPPPSALGVALFKFPLPLAAPHKCCLLPAVTQDYEALPVEEFGKALLRGLGWSDGQGVGRKRQVCAVQAAATAAAAAAAYRTLHVMRREWHALWYLSRCSLALCDVILFSQSLPPCCSGRLCWCRSLSQNRPFDVLTAWAWVQIQQHPRQTSGRERWVSAAGSDAAVAAAATAVL